jgi:hypothetical protein
MPAPFQVAVLVGSLRRESLNRKAAKAVAEAAPKSLQFRFPQIGDLAFYNEDAETEQPPNLWQAFRDELRGADAFLFATPDYNRQSSFATDGGVSRHADDAAAGNVSVARSQAVRRAGRARR